MTGLGHRDGEPAGAAAQVGHPVGGALGENGHEEVVLPAPGTLGVMDVDESWVVEFAMPHTQDFKRAVGS
ncbi:hypothetical protein Are01nite_13630 [Actinoplanes regularis]|nr:hypothetical protein Are01nite_13630 [Actinoplanes regularis]